MKVLFLDIDGVLNSCNTKAKVGFERAIEEDKIVLLEEIVERTKAEIVLISSWRENWYKGKTEKEGKTKWLIILTINWRSATLKYLIRFITVLIELAVFQCGY